MAFVDTDIIRLNVEMDPAEAIAGLKRMNDAFDEIVQNIGSNISEMENLVADNVTEMTKGWREYKKQADLVYSTNDRIMKGIPTLVSQMHEIRNAMSFKGIGPEQMKSYQDALAQLEKRFEELNEEKKKLERVDIKTKNIALEKALESTKTSVKEAFSPVTAIFEKDLPRAIESATKLFGKGIEKSFPALGGAIENLGTSLFSKGTKKSLAAIGGSGVKNAMSGAMGGAMSSMGKLFQELGPLIKTLSSIGPVLSVAAGSVMALVKLFIDAQAQAKEFQKDLLATASTGEFLADAGNKAQVGYANLADTVKDLRDAAFDLETNMKWGITSKDHVAFLNVLTQEGVSLHRMSQEMEKARQDGEALGGAVKYYAQQTATAVAFSRNFGVQLSEVANFQSNLMVDMGMSLKKVNEHFATMAYEANKSSMATNKFFAIMKGISSDLALYNVRMDAAARLLSRLSKAMSPQTAEKFMSTLSRGFKEMGRLDKVRMTLLAGKETTRKIVQDDIKIKKKALVEELGSRLKGGKQEAQTLMDAYLKGSKGAALNLSKALREVEGGGALRERASRLKMQQQTARMGTFGLAQAIGDLGIGGVIKMQKAALGRFANPGDTLMDMIGKLGPEMMAENLGITQEQLKQMAMMEQAINETREDLLAQAEGDQKKQAEIMKMSDDELLKASGIDAKKQLKTQKDFAQEQTDLTQTVIDKLQVLIDFLMNQFYNVVVGIWDSIEGMLPGGGKHAEEIAIARLKNAEVSKAYQKSGGDMYAFRGNLAGGAAGEALVKVLHGQAGTRKQQEQIRKEAGEILNKRMKPGVGLKYMPKSISGMLSKDKIAKLEEVRKKVQEVDYYAGGSPHFKNENHSFSDVLQQAVVEGAISMDEASDILSKALWESNDTKEMAGLAADVLKVTGGAPTPKPTPKPAPKPAPTSKPEPKPAPAPEKPTEPEQPKTRTGTTTVEHIRPQAPKPPQEKATEAIEKPPLPEDAPTADQTDQQLELADGQYHTQQEMRDALRKQGIKLDATLYKSGIAPIMEDSMYQAMSRALFEYWLYSGKPSEIKSWLSWVEQHTKTDVLTPQSMSGAAIQWAQQNTSLPIRPNAKGGIVTGISGGLAIVSPAPGEGLASVGPGEKIVPRGGAQTSMAIKVDVTGQQGPNFEKYLETVIRNAIYDYEAKKRIL